METNVTTTTKPQHDAKLPVGSSDGFEQELQNNFGASDYDMMMIFGTSASEQATYLRNNPHLQGIVEPMEGYVTSRLSGLW